MNAKTILITGATAGIGRFTALHLARQGHRLFATGRSEKALAELKAEAGSAPLETLTLDVTDAASIAAAAAEVQRRTDGKGLDVLINNAGYGHSSPVEGLTDEALKAQFDTNVFGLVQVTRAFLPPMRARGAGRIINVASVLGHMSLPFMGAYCATKYALEALTDALRIELSAFGIQAILVEPGTINSEFEARTAESVSAIRNGPYAPFVDAYEKILRLSYKIAGRPAHVARAIDRAINAWWPRARYQTPLRWRIALALFLATPTRIADWMLRAGGGFSRKRLAAKSTLAPTASV